MSFVNACFEWANVFLSHCSQISSCFACVLMWRRGFTVHTDASECLAWTCLTFHTVKHLCTHFLVFYIWFINHIMLLFHLYLILEKIHCSQPVQQIEVYLLKYNLLEVILLWLTVCFREFISLYFSLFVSSSQGI